MFGEVAMGLLRFMGTTGSVPGAMLAAEIPGALQRLRVSLASAPSEKTVDGTGEDDEGTTVNLRTRAFPLVRLLEAAAALGCDLIWEDEGKATG